MSGYGGEDWRAHLYNQERILSGLDQVSDQFKDLLETQKRMAEFASRLHDNMDTLDETLKESSRTLSGFVTKVAQVPIVIVLMGIASWAFYLGKLSEKGWIILVVAASFQYIGEGVMAIAKVIRGGNGGSK
jgi:hypothetical protein